MRRILSAAMTCARTALAVGLPLVCAAPPAQAQTWNLTTGGSWAVSTNWDPAAVPNAVGAAAAFTGTNTANRAITVDSGAGGFTVGSISFDTTGAGAFTNAVQVGTAGSNLKLDNGGAGVTITTTGTGTGNNTISAALVFNDNVTAVLNQTTATSVQGSLNLTAAVTGNGGFTLQGSGGLTFGTAAKAYNGPTLFGTNTGRIRYSAAGSVTGTGSVTVNPGAQLDLITTGTYTFGSVLNLNGTGIAAFPGAIRVETNFAATTATPVVLQSNSAINISGATGTLTLNGGVSGPGRLTLGELPGAATDGTLNLNGTNTYSGGTLINLGTLVAGAASTTALGTGNVTVEGVVATTGGKLTITAGATNAIANTATLTLTGGGTAGTADVGFVTLGAGINETVGGLVLGGVTQLTPGTYGSTASGATFTSDEFFAGTGVVTLTPVPEPTGVLVAAGAALGVARLVRRRRPAPPGR